MSAGSRGKWAEGEVKKKLKLYSAFSSFAFLRLPDARAGSFQATLADFQVMHTGQFGLIEVKEVATHDYRLPYGNFTSDKVGMLRAWQMAGATVAILICHRPGAKTAMWRLANLEFFMRRDPEKPSGSWDLSSIPTANLSALFEVLYGPPPNG